LTPPTTDHRNGGSSTNGRTAGRGPVEVDAVCPDTTCVYYVVYTQHMGTFGGFVRDRREALRTQDSSYSVRQVAARIGVQPSYLSKVERDETAPPSEAKVKALAEELGLDPDVLLALAGKVSTDLQDVIRKRPELFSALIRQLKDAPDNAVLRVVREVRDGDW